MIDPISVTLAAWMATCVLTNVPEKEDLEPSTELKQESDELFSVLEKKAPIVAAAVKEARKQPVGDAQVYVVVNVEIAALKDSEIDKLVKAVAEQVKSQTEIYSKIYNNSAKLAENIGILIQGDKSIIKIENLDVNQEKENLENEGDKLRSDRDGDTSPEDNSLNLDEFLKSIDRLTDGDLASETLWELSNSSDSINDVDLSAFSDLDDLEEHRELERKKQLSNSYQHQIIIQNQLLPEFQE